MHHVDLKIVLWGGLAARLTKTRSVVNAVNGLGTFLLMEISIPSPNGFSCGSSNFPITGLISRQYSKIKTINPFLSTGISSEKHRPLWLKDRVSTSKPMQKRSTAQRSHKNRIRCAYHPGERNPRFDRRRRNPSSRIWEQMSNPDMRRHRIEPSRHFQRGTRPTMRRPVHHIQGALSEHATNLGNVRHSRTSFLL